MAFHHPLCYRFCESTIFFAVSWKAALKVTLASCHIDKHLLRTGFVSGIMLKMSWQVSATVTSLVICDRWVIFPCWDLAHTTIVPVPKLWGGCHFCKHVQKPNMCKTVYLYSYLCKIFHYFPLCPFSIYQVCGLD